MIEAIFHGHSFVEIESGAGSILIDPFITGNPSCDTSVDALLTKSLQAIVVTHGHEDHLGDTVELATKTGCKVITTFELGKWLQEKQGLKEVSMHGIGGGVHYEGFHVMFFQAWHGGGIGDMQDGYATVAAGVVLQLQGKTIYHAGDTGLFSDMKLLKELYTIDLAFLPIGDRFTMGVDHAVLATKYISPKVVVPVHYDTRPVIKADAVEFSRRVMLDNLSVPKVLRPGQVVVLT